ncbi:hypothetical protein BAMY6639_00835 [Bacillus amyloliquefaciens UMAF6639]|nr:hypothetical protein BAMY6639_00835 [Bacillus amyloliquefaciens UMAF6639]
MMLSYKEKARLQRAFFNDMLAYYNGRLFFRSS